MEAFRRGLERDQNHALLHWDLALASEKLGRKDDAVRHLKRALSLNLDASLKRYASVLLNAIKGTSD